MSKQLSPAEIQKLLSYNPETGKLYWKERDISYFKDERAWKIWNTRYANTEAFTAFSSERGSRNGAIFGRNYLSHRIAWAIYHGEWPAHTIDHINGIPSDNRMVNLRAATQQAQNQNLPTRIDNTTGRVGVTKATNANRWIARINTSGKTKHVGCFKTFEEACAARADAEVRHGYHENHGRKLAA